MKLLILISYISVMLFSCTNKLDHPYIQLTNKLESSYFKKYRVFDDKDYLLTLTTIDTTASFNIGRPTVVINLFHKNLDKIDTLINDSLFSKNPLGTDPEIKLEFIDFNFDGINDFIIPFGTDPRGNRGFHLYIVNNKNKRIQRVIGFNDIGNPKPDSTYKIINSFVLAGPSFCRFYIINSTNELIDLDHYTEFLDFDSLDTKIQREMKKITTIR